MPNRIYLYADETGNLDYAGSPNPRGGGASTYFGFGTATFSTGSHGEDLLSGLHLRAKCAKAGIKLTKGFHACDDSNKTRSEMFAEIQKQAPRFDTTFLLKSNAYPSIKAAGPMRLYKMAWYLHLKDIALKVSEPGDELFVVVAEFGTSGSVRPHTRPSTKFVNKFNGTLPSVSGQLSHRGVCKSLITDSGQFREISKERNAHGTSLALNRLLRAYLHLGVAFERTEAGYPTYRGRKSSPGGLIAGFNLILLCTPNQSQPLMPS